MFLSFKNSRDVWRRRFNKAYFISVLIYWYDQRIIVPFMLWQNRYVSWTYFGLNIMMYYVGNLENNKILREKTITIYQENNKNLTRFQFLCSPSSQEYVVNMIWFIMSWLIAWQLLRLSPYYFNPCLTNYDTLIFDKLFPCRKL